MTEMTETDKTQAVSPDTPELGSDVAGDFAALTTERDRLGTEKAELYEQLLRRTAEFENFRRRTERERIELSEYAAMETVKSLLPVLDDFERALKIETADKEYSKGMELIYSRMLELLKKSGLEPVAAEGRIFDPNVHEAIERVSETDAEDQTVLGAFQRGYQFRGRLLRPAMVRVAVKS